MSVYFLYLNCFSFSTVMRCTNYPFYVALLKVFFLSIQYRIYYFKKTYFAWENVLFRIKTCDTQTSVLNYFHTYIYTVLTHTPASLHQLHERTKADVFSAYPCNACICLRYGDRYTDRERGNNTYR